MSTTPEQERIFALESAIIDAIVMGLSGESIDGIDSLSERFPRLCDAAIAITISNDDSDGDDEIAAAQHERDRAAHFAAVADFYEREGIERPTGSIVYEQHVAGVRLGDLGLVPTATGRVIGSTTYVDGVAVSSTGLRVEIDEQQQHNRAELRDEISDLAARRAAGLPLDEQ
jgi:hypothetical protein